jgi:proteasome lid subunit RPN8/RPN11
MLERLKLSAEHWERMREHVHAFDPLEACGLLIGKGEIVYSVLPVANAAHSPIRFRMDPGGQLLAFREMEEHGLELLGIFHSHPADGGNGTNALEGPSETDVREAAYPVVHVIWSKRAGQWEARGFWIDGGRISVVPLLVSETK